MRPALLLLALCGGVVSAATVEIVAGSGAATLSARIELVEPFGVAFAPDGQWFICEHKGERITSISSRGEASVFAGTGEAAYGGDGGPATHAQFKDPHGLVMKGLSMYVADTQNHRVRHIDLRSGIVRTIAGTGEAGYSGDGGPAVNAAFNGAFSVDLEPAGNILYVTDLGNRRIRAIDLRTGVVTTVAGNGPSGVPRDGARAVDEPLVDPRAAVADSEGNVYILERRGNALRVVDKGGTIRTLIAPGMFQPDMNGPKHLCLDGGGNVIIADAENHMIRRYTLKDRRLVTIAGTGEKGDRVVADSPMQTQLNRPHGVYVHRSGDLYIADSDNHRVLRLRDW